MHTEYLLVYLLGALLSSANGMGISELLPDNWQSPWEQAYYKDGDPVDLLVNSIESENTQLPYAYYHLPFVCPPKPETRPVQLSVGEVLNGDRLWMSDYQLNFGVDEPCLRLCDRITKPEAVKMASDLIKKDYTINWWIDGIPGSTTLIKPRTRTEPAKKFYAPGFRLGFVADDVSYLHNHVMIVIRWHAQHHDRLKKTIVGFEVYPKSVSDAHCPGASHDFANFALDPNAKEKTVIPFTYSIYWREDPFLDYENRYSLYVDPSLKGNEGRMHWFAIINALVLVSLISMLAAAVLLKTLHSETSSNVSVWQAVANEVFLQGDRIPELCVLAGTGVQLMFTIAGSCLLFSSQSASLSHSVLSAAMTLFVFAGFFAGFSSVQFYKRFVAHPNFDASLKIALLSGSLLTGLCSVVLLLCNLFTFEKQSSRVINLSTIMVLVSIYILLQVPISITGGFLSNKVDMFEILLKGRALTPTEPSVNTHRDIPPQSKLLKWKYLLPTCGLIPFSIIFIEMVYMYKSLFVNKSSVGATSSNSIFSFLTITTILLSIVVAEISIITTYLRLNGGDYMNWQWKSFFTSSGSILLYLTVYTFYYLSKMKMVDAVSPILYVIYSTMLNVLVSIACGSLGLISSSWFVYNIYTYAKKD